jgi:hypothetical protein
LARATYSGGGEPIGIDTSTAAEVMAEARRLGADAIQANHPFIPYGYLASLESGVVPGGFAADFDLLEMNGGDDDPAVFERARQLWSQGQRIYLAGGSDAHDVWNDTTGAARAYGTRGPLIVPEVKFGSDLRIAPGQERTLSFEVDVLPSD